MLSGNGTIDYDAEAHTLDAHKTSTSHQVSTTKNLHGSITKNFQGSAAKDFQNHLSWDLELPLIEFTYNATPHSTTQTSPFIADLGYEPNLPTITTGQRILAASDRAVDFVTKQKAILLRTRDLITEFQRDQEAAANGQPQHRDETYEVGEYVLLNRGALFHRGEVLENTTFICRSI